MIKKLISKYLINIKRIEPSTAFQRKMADLSTNERISHKNRQFSTDKSNIILEDESNVFRNEIKSKVLDKSKIKNEAHLKKTIDLSSSLHRREFYDQNLRSDQNEPNVKMYEIKNTDKLDLKTFENIFAEKGMHIYGLKANSNFTGGSTNSSLTFNIRESNKSIGEINSVKEKLNNMGLKMKELMGIKSSKGM
jgi:hypothetical protein